MTHPETRPRRRHRRLRRASGTLLIVLLISGCGATASFQPEQAYPEAGGEPLRVVMMVPAYQGFDPQASFTLQQYELLRCCLVRTLMMFRGLPEFAGTTPVPDLASEPPSVSSDGMTWTFDIRPGIRYAPPLQDVEVTSGDIARALLRAGSSGARGPGADLLRVIEGFDAYARGDADAIAGVATPDASTLRIRTTRPDRSISHLFGMAFTAPIPPNPADPSALFGAASGHPFASDVSGGPPDRDGYGPFLIGTGPYMIEGAEMLDPSLAPGEQVPVSGFTPGWWFDDPGQLVLVRNPAWDPATDPNRPALAQRIEISIMPEADPYELLDRGATDVVIGENPPPEVVHRYRSTESLRDRLAAVAGNFSWFVAINVAQPPFDDEHVRRAVGLVLDRRALAASVGASSSSHLIPDPMIGALLSSWSPDPQANEGGDLVRAQAEMNASRYGSHGMCADPACDGVLVRPPSDAGDAEIRSIRERLASVGIDAVFREADCSDAEAHVGLCVMGWFTDYPEAGNMVAPFVSGGFSPTLLGSTPRELSKWGYTTNHVPSIDADHDRCAAMTGVPAAMCWARLDQMLSGTLAALVPIGFGEVVRVRGADVSAYSLDQAFGEPALDRIAVTR